MVPEGGRAGPGKRAGAQRRRGGGGAGRADHRAFLRPRAGAGAQSRRPPRRLAARQQRSRARRGPERIRRGRQGSTLLNYAGVGRETLDFVVDRSTYKQGLYLPGVRLPVRPPEALLAEQPTRWCCSPGTSRTRSSPSRRSTFGAAARRAARPRRRLLESAQGDAARDALPGRAVRRGEGRLLPARRGPRRDVDLRGDSPAFRRWFAARLDPESLTALYIPAGVAHGFLT